MTTPPAAKTDDIAIIGMAGRFPGAPDIETFWANVRDGVESIRRLTDEQLLAAGVTRGELGDPDYVKACPVLDDVDKFDAAFFGFSPREASVMDPAHRLFLEIAWQAVEHAGYTALPEEGAVGVFAGAGAPLYMIENLRSNPDLMRSMGEFLVRHTGNDMNFLATRVSYEMDLRGPSMNVQTACSSALVSLHMACQSLLRGECAMALAGGSTVLFPRERGYLYKEGEILSPDGHCRPFDARSAGTVFGSGAGVVVLKRLSDALDDGDTIHAVVKGSAVNNDGALKVGYLAPGVEGQAAVIASALADARVDAGTIGYIEAHGTGTLVGDPIEVEALNAAFRPRTDRRGYCALGSVKSNIGHLGEAASAASLIKAVMALKHRQLPPSLGYETPNPAIDFEDSPFFVNASLRPWQAEGPLRCGVTALGAGGTNCHVVLEEAPPPLPGEGERSQQLLVLSAKTKTALDQAGENLAAALASDPALDLADAAYTLAVGRRAMVHRRVLAVAGRDDAIARLREAKQGATDQAQDGRPKTVFMFPGGGAQYARMGAELYEQEPVYREAMDACLAIINPALGRDLGVLLFADEADAETATRALEQPSLTLPALFATEYAMARLFQSWGVTAEAFIGHSLGEYAAACLAGVVSLEDALRLVMLRGRLFEQVERGGMLSTPLSEADLRAIAPADLSIAAVNAPDLTVASGPVASIEALRARLADQEIESTPVRIDVAAHSAMLDPVLDTFRALCRTIAFRAPQVPFVSNVTGAWITPEQATDPEYWVTHLRSTVRFADGLASLRPLGEPVLLEVGPGRTLNMLARAQATPFRYAVNCMRHPQETASDLAYALTSLGRLWAAGAEVDWSAFYDGQLRNRTPLPTYPFERKSFWVEPGAVSAPTASQDLVRRADLSEWFYGLGFAEAPLVRAGAAAPQRWLIVSETPGPARALARSLGSDRVLTACAGRRFATPAKGLWRFDFDDPEHYVRVVQAAEDAGGPALHVVFLAPHGRGGRVEGSEIARHFLHPTYLVQAVGGLSAPAQFSIVTSGLSGVDGQSVHPSHALSLGPALVSPRELAHVRTRCIDMPVGPARGDRGRRAWNRLIDELRGQADDTLVALTATARWVRKAEPLPLAAPAASSVAAWLGEGDVYLITGGLGGVGLAVAEHMARAKPVKLALLSREALPPEGAWDATCEAGPQSRTAKRIAKVRALRALGAQVMVVAADVADRASLGEALAQVRRAFGPLNGVIHAAGVMDDAPLMAKSRQDMARVLAPKVAGTLALDALIHEELDAFVLFSSVASFLGLPGQVDYTAANAFLDAFARARSQRARGRTVVINWSAWRDVGMAADALRRQTEGLAPAKPSSHPAFEGYTDQDGARTFVAAFNPQTNWLLSEHVVAGGAAVLPGTAFVELARAAFSEGREGAVELSDLTFVAPFQVADGETRRLSVRLTPSDDGVEIEMRPDGDVLGAPIVIGEARPYRGAAPVPVDVGALAGRCDVRDWKPANGFLAQSFMRFGPRWANLRRIRYGHGEALVELKLDDRFADDAAWGLHPAVMDMATGGAQALIPGVDLARDFYVPISYGRVRVFAPMPRSVVSHVRCLPGSGERLAYFDVTLADEDGQVFAEVSRFAMKRIEPTSLAPSAARPPASHARAGAMDAVLREAIDAPGGLEAFERIMAQPHIVQAVASSVDVMLWNRQLTQQAQDRSSDEAAAEGFQRPELAADYAAPTTAAERALASIWSELLGVRQVGVNDDFFDLGGNSLVGVRLFAAVKRKLGVALSLATLFEAPTIAGLAALLPAEGVEPSVGEASAWSPLVRISAGAEGRTPVFCVHGSRGNVMIFKSLADRLGATRPFYALQARGVDGELEPDETIEAMAERYLGAIREVQPTGPYILAGYSGGGVIAYEMAQRLTAAGESVDALVMIDTLEPNEMRAPITMLDRVRNLHRVKLWRFFALPGVLWRHHVAPWARRLLGVTHEAAPLTGLEIAAVAVDAAYHRAQWAYQTQPYNGDVVLFRAKDARMHFLRCGPTLGWRHFVRGRIHRVDVDADHFTVFDEPAVSQMASAIRAALRGEMDLAPKPRRARAPMRRGGGAPANLASSGWA